MLMFFIAYHLYKDATRTQHRNNIVNIDPETLAESRFRLGSIRRIKGSRSIFIPLHSSQSFDLRYSGKSVTSTRNFLFYDTQKGSQFWLLPTNRYLVASHNIVESPRDSDESTTAIAILYQMVKEDTNHDNRLTDSDLLTIALSDINGQHYTEILGGVDSVSGQFVTEDERIAILLSINGKGFTVLVDTDGFGLVDKIPMPEI